MQHWGSHSRRSFTRGVLVGGIGLNGWDERMDGWMGVRVCSDYLLDMCINTCTDLGGGR